MFISSGAKALQQLQSMAAAASRRSRGDMVILVQDDGDNELNVTRHKNRFRANLANSLSIIGENRSVEGKTSNAA